MTDNNCPTDNPDDDDDNSPGECRPTDNSARPVPAFLPPARQPGNEVFRLLTIDCRLFQLTIPPPPFPLANGAEPPIGAAASHVPVAHPPISDIKTLPPSPSSPMRVRRSRWLLILDC